MGPLWISGILFWPQVGPLITACRRVLNAVRFRNIGVLSLMWIWTGKQWWTKTPPLQTRWLWVRCVWPSIDKVKLGTVVLYCILGGLTKIKKSSKSWIIDSGYFCLAKFQHIANTNTNDTSSWWVSTCWSFTISTSFFYRHLILPVALYLTHIFQQLLLDLFRYQLHPIRHF